MAAARAGAAHRRRDLCLGFLAAYAQHPHAGGELGRIAQQCGLGDVGLAMNDDRPT